MDEIIPPEPLQTETAGLTLGVLAAMQISDHVCFTGKLYRRCDGIVKAINAINARALSQFGWKASVSEVFMGGALLKLGQEYT